MSSIKRHFHLLDGLRGVAAVCVVLFHFMEVVFSDYSKNFIGHGFLAVDFFFCLSGFVIGYAYDDRIKEMGLSNFFRQRLIRLHPLVVLGSVLGLAGFLWWLFRGHMGAYSMGRIAVIFVASVSLIPFPVMADRGYNLFGLNAPAWSLFWEYVINIVYALVLCRVSRRVLGFLTMGAAVGIWWVVFRAGSLMGGWSGGTFWDGGLRVAYSFFAGLLVYRCGWRIKTKLNFIHLSILLVLAFIMPFSLSWNWLTEPLVVVFYFPLLVAVGAGMDPGGFQRLCVFSGKISYPLYMTHYAAIWVFADYYTVHGLSSGRLALVIGGGILGLLGVAYVAMVGYDGPVRRWLASGKGK